MDEDGPEADKFAGVARDEVLSEGAGVDPVFEAELAFLSGAGGHADGEDGPADDGDDFEGGEPHFEFAVDAHGEEIDRGEDGPEDGDDDTDVKVGVPVLYRKTGGG